MADQHIQPQGVFIMQVAVRKYEATQRQVVAVWALMQAAVLAFILTVKPWLNLLVFM